MPVEVQGCIYPTNAELMMLQAELLPRYADGRLAFDLLPFKETSYAKVILNRPDIFRGLQQWRGLDKPTRTPRDQYNYIGEYCEINPGYWGECDYITERDLTLLAAPGSCREPIDITERVVRMQERLLERRYNRVEYNIWQALAYGTSQAFGEDGKLIHEEVFNIQMITVGIPWSDPDNSTPIQDLRCVRLLGRGTSTNFNNTAKAYMNQVTANCLMSNRNANDLGNLQITACCELALFGMNAINMKLTANGLPNLEVYDEGWIDESGNFHPFIPDGKVIVMGVRPGSEPLGNYWLTRNVLGCEVDTGFWQNIHDSCTWGQVPRKISVNDGHNGIPALHYPRGIISIETGCTFNC